MFDFDEDFINQQAEKYFSLVKELSDMPDDKIDMNVGLDIGTMNLVMAENRNNEVNTKSLRNVFLKIDPSSLGTTDLSLIGHTKIDDSVYILADDAYTFGNIFSQEVSRPMAKGMISSSEIDSIDILGVMVKSLIGVAPTSNSVCCYSIPANPIDADMNVLFHDNVFKRLVHQLGWKPMSLYEGASLIYSECSDTNFTGIGISFGAGMTNVSVVFKGAIVLKFALARGGDWIDQNTANHIAGLVSTRITQIKEKPDFNLTDFNCSDKKERRIREALIYYYNDLISYTIHQISEQLSNIQSQFPSELPIIISGGTSKPIGFIEIIQKMFLEHEFPFAISKIKHADNPLTAVAEGCLIRSYKS